jgi:hypothetical protein
MAAAYGDVKSAAIGIVDDYSIHHKVALGYGEPWDAPEFSAETPLASIGLNMHVRRAMMKAINARMRARFPDDWRAITQTELRETETIGAFIELMCGHASAELPAGEPT